MFEKKKIITENVYIASIRLQWNYKGLCGKYKVFPLLNECGDLPFFISNFKFPLGNQPICKVWLKIYVQFYFGGMTLSSSTK